MCDEPVSHPVVSVRRVEVRAFNTLIDDLVAALLPVRCPGCGRRAHALCSHCLATFRAAPPAPLPLGVDWATACFAYDGVVREIIARAKYRNERPALRVLGDHLADFAARAPAPIDLVTWTPASRDRYARTGVDHAAILGRRVAFHLCVPARSLLRRGRDEPQTGRDVVSRRRGPSVVAVGDVTDLVVLVVDDVTTTGGSLAAAARALRQRGARAVFAATLARTPRPGRAIRNDAYTSATTPG